jgi:hypothetical protein
MVESSAKRPSGCELYVLRRSAIEDAEKHRSGDDGRHGARFQYSGHQCPRFLDQQRRLSQSGWRMVLRCHGLRGARRHRYDWGRMAGRRYRAHSLQRGGSQSRRQAVDLPASRQEPPLRVCAAAKLLNGRADQFALSRPVSPTTRAIDKIFARRFRRVPAPCPSSSRARATRRRSWLRANGLRSKPRN